MVTAVGGRMGTKGGRPHKSDGDSGTEQMRVFADLKEMVTWVARVTNTTSAKLVDPLLRHDITFLYDKHRAEIDRLKKLEADLEQAEQEIREQAAKEPQVKPPQKRK